MRIVKHATGSFGDSGAPRSEDLSGAAGAGAARRVSPRRIAAVTLIAAAGLVLYATLLAAGETFREGAAATAGAGASPNSARAGVPAPPPPAPRATGAFVPDPPDDKMGAEAPLLIVDRFSDAAGSRLRRSVHLDLPGPGQPIDLDAPAFLRTVEGQDGSPQSCYDLDLRSEKPGRFYVFYDTLNQYIITQFPVIDRAPGDPNYTDMWEIWKVVIPNGQPRDNRIRDFETVQTLVSDPSSGYKAVKTGSLLNAPIVPDGSRASMKADNRAGAVALLYSWYRGRRAPYFYFEQYLLSDSDAPVSTMRTRTPADPMEQKAGDAAGNSVPVVGALPMQPGYSPLMKITGPDGKPFYETPINCPIVGMRGKPVEPPAR